MLAADKVLVQRQLEVDLLSLRQKELVHFTNCLNTLAAPAALLAGFAFVGTTGQVEIPDGTHWALEGLYFVITALAMVCEIAATIRATLVSLMGPALALRGRGAPPMHRAVEMMETSFKGAWQSFVAGLRLMIVSVLLFIIMQVEEWAMALFLGLLVVAGAGFLWKDTSRLGRTFAIPVGEFVLGVFAHDDLHRSKGRKSDAAAVRTESCSPTARKDSATTIRRLSAHARRSSKSVLVGADPGYLPCVSTLPPSCPSAQYDRPCESSTVDRQEQNEMGLVVVLSMRKGARMRWRVSSGTTVAQLIKDAEAHFGVTISALSTAQGGIVMNPDTTLVREFARTEVGTLDPIAFFNVLPAPGQPVRA